MEQPAVNQYSTQFPTLQEQFTNILPLKSPTFITITMAHHIIRETTFFLTDIVASKTMSWTNPLMPIFKNMDVA